MKRTNMIAGLALSFVWGFVGFASAANAAEEWGLDGEKIARFDAKVVDIACELTGDCPANCGGGKRHLGLLKADGKLILPVKNQDIFAGVINDLLPFCGKTVTADGLMISSKHMPLFAMQFKRPEGGKWARADWFGKDWSKANGGQKSGQWFKADKRILSVIKKDGVYGIPGLKPPKDE